MTEPRTPPGRPLRPWLDDLPEARHHVLLDHAGAGVFNARHAAQCLTEAGTPHHETTLQLQVYLSEAVRELEAARAIVREQMEGEGTQEKEG